MPHTHLQVSLEFPSPFTPTMCTTLTFYQQCTSVTTIRLFCKYCNNYCYFNSKMLLFLIFKIGPVKELHDWQWWHLSKDPKTEVPVDHLSPNQLDGLIKINIKLVPRGLDPQLVFKAGLVKENYTIDNGDVCLKIQRLKKYQLLGLSPNQLDGQIKINNKLVPRGFDPQFWLIDQCPWTLNS